MRRSPLRTLAVWVAAVCFTVHPCRAQDLQISGPQAEAAGKHLWKNECGGTVAGLTSWNTGEDFASLGIGHYIWYSAGRRGPFEESFPPLLRFLEANGAPVPTWLRATPACPWNSKAAFDRDRSAERMTELRNLLANTVPLQARFSVNRLEESLPKMLADEAPPKREIIRQQFRRVATSPNGVYALVDYVNFKGEGVLPTERYQGQGWGLLQVLADMKTDPTSAPGVRAMQDFSQSADRVLTLRVANSPPDRHEAKWLAGWKNRVATYAEQN